MSESKIRTAELILIKSRTKVHFIYFIYVMTERMRLLILLYYMKNYLLKKNMDETTFTIYNNKFFRLFQILLAEKTVKKL